MSRLTEEELINIPLEEEEDLRAIEMMNMEDEDLRALEKEKNESLEKNLMREGELLSKDDNVSVKVNGGKRKSRRNKKGVKKSRKSRRKLRKGRRKSRKNCH